MMNYQAYELPVNCGQWLASDYYIIVYKGWYAIFQLKVVSGRQYEIDICIYMYIKSFFKLIYMMPLFKAHLYDAI